MNSNKSWIPYVGCVIAGLVAGYLCGATYSHSLMAKTIAYQDVQLVASGLRAYDAYRHEPAPIAIYALTQYIATLDDAEDLDGVTSTVTSRPEIERRLMLAHARLARLLETNGDTKASAIHVNEALRCARESGKFASVKTSGQLFAMLPEDDQKQTP
jgi:hypothetical protein